MKMSFSKRWPSKFVSETQVDTQVNFRDAL